MRDNSGQNLIVHADGSCDEDVHLPASQQAAFVA